MDVEVQGYPRFAVAHYIQHGTWHAPCNMTHDGAVDFQEGEAQSYDVYDIKIKLVIDRSVDALTVHSRARAPALTYARAYVRACVRARLRTRTRTRTSHHITSQHSLTLNSGRS